MTKTHKPWGSEELLVKTDHYALKHIFYANGERTSLQYHNHKTETLFVLVGDGLLEIDDRRVRMTQGTVHTILPGERHRVTGGWMLEVLEISTAELDDIVRLEDDYGRTT